MAERGGGEVEIEHKYRMWESRIMGDNWLRAEKAESSMPRRGKKR